MVKTTLSKIEEELDECLFRIGRSFIMNLNHIYSTSRNEVILSGGSKVPLSRGMYEKLNQTSIRLFCFLGGLMSILSKCVDKKPAAYQRDLIETHYAEVENMYRQITGLMVKSKLCRRIESILNREDYENAAELSGVETQRLML